MKTYPKPTHSQVVKTLREWGYNDGEFEEVVASLAQRAELISYATAEIHSNHISYRLDLTKAGREFFENWCAENGYTRLELKGQAHNILIFDDEDEESVQNTLDEWKIMKEE